MVTSRDAALESVGRDEQEGHHRTATPIRATMQDREKLQINAIIVTLLESIYRNAQSSQTVSIGQFLTNRVV